MLTFPRSTVDRFFLEFWSDPKKKGTLRMGQAFHQYMKLEKVSSEKDWCDRLYQLDGEEAKKMIASRTYYDGD